MQTEIADFSVDRLDCSIDVLRIHTRANDKRTLSEVRVEVAERVVRHPLPFTNIVGQPPAEAELPEDIVQDPIGVIARIEAADSRESISDVGLRFSWHRDLTNTPARPGGRRRNDNWPLSRAAPILEQLRRSVDRPRSEEHTSELQS